MTRAATRAAALAGIAIRYPEELPVSQRRDDIAAAIKDHQVVIVAGETGSGKTTQLPKICLELGRGITGQIGHTQPRRIAARTVAERIAEELGTPLGDVVGYKVRFTDRSGDATAVKLMTDGILLAEIGTDRNLTRYDTLIIDEAHERSLNIDFILGYLRQLLPRRPDLKVIITSATIDPERFAEHFKDQRTQAPAPIVEVSGRTYPVEVRYRPINDQERDHDEDRDQVTAVTDAIGELEREGPGDILVFLSGEQEIRDTADALKGRANTDVLPLYSRLSSAEQHRVFEVPANRTMASRRVVLATNVAETSLTVPGIRYVIDPGTARISRYSLRTKVQRLPIEAISQASANQRKGRCGRVADGICIRLYSQEDFESRPEFTDPEIQRTNLASVILQMAAARLGDVRKFPFVDPPDPRAITDGVKLLEELNAVKDDRLTETGRQMARLPVDPRIARMIIESGKQGCAREILIMAAALSIQDPRERPTDNQQAADTAHRRFAQPESDFLAFVALWDYLAERQRELSGSAFRRLCRAEYLNYLRVREWQDLHGQLASLTRDLGINTKTSSSERVRVHTALLAGLLSQVGMKVVLTQARPGRYGRPGGTERGRRPLPEYLGARGTKFAVFPGSGLARKPPDWIVAAELVETSRLWARTVAAIEPEWVEPVAAHLVKRSYSEPRWSRNSGAAVATEKVTLYGIPIVADRTVLLHRIDRVLARELFIRHALVEGDWQTRHHFFRDNAKLIEEAAALEQRARRRGLVVGEDALFAFYDARVPADAVSARHFDTWWKTALSRTPDLLTLSLDDLLSSAADELDVGAYPEVWTSASPGLTGTGGQAAGLALSYAFDPGSESDGVTIDIPLKTLNQAHPEEFSWQVPGLRMELVTELIRSLPKHLRRELVPAPNVAREVLADLGDGTAHDVRDTLSRELLRLRGVRVFPDDFDLDKLPPHLRINFRVHGRRQGRGRGQGPGRTPAPAAAQGACHPVGPRDRADQDRSHVMGLRAAPGGLHRRGSQGVPGARRRGRGRRRPPVRERRRRRALNAGRDQAARPARREVPRQRGREAAHHGAEARAQRQPPRLRRRPVHRLRRLRRRRAHHRSRRPRLGRRSVHPDRRARQAPAARGNLRGGHLGGRDPAGRARGADAPRHAAQPGARPRRRRHPRATRPPDRPRVPHRGRRHPAARARPLRQGRRPPPGQAGGERRPGRTADGRGAPGPGRVRDRPGRTPGRGQVERRGQGDPLADRGAQGQPLRPDDGHADAGLRAQDHDLHRAPRRLGAD